MATSRARRPARTLGVAATVRVLAPAHRRGDAAHLRRLERLLTTASAP